MYGDGFPFVGFVICLSMYFNVVFICDVVTCLPMYFNVVLIRDVVLIIVLSILLYICMNMYSQLKLF